LGFANCPSVHSVGRVANYELALEQLLAQREVDERLQFDEDRFKAFIAVKRAEIDAAKTIKNIQLNAKTATARQIAQ